MKHTKEITRVRKQFTKGGWFISNVRIANHLEPPELVVTVSPILKPNQPWRGDIVRLQSSNGIDGTSNAETLASAHLIASAPSMLKALKGLFRAYAKCNGAEGEEYNEAMRIIAKAEARS